LGLEGERKEEDVDEEEEEGAGGDRKGFPELLVDLELDIPEPVRGRERGRGCATEFKVLNPLAGPADGDVRGDVEFREAENGIVLLEN
jgi:hypothetical protein